MLRIRDCYFLWAHNVHRFGDFEVDSTKRDLSSCYRTINFFLNTYCSQCGQWRVVLFEVNTLLLKFIKTSSIHLTLNLYKSQLFYQLTLVYNLNIHCKLNLVKYFFATISVFLVGHKMFCYLFFL